MASNELPITQFSVLRLLEVVAVVSLCLAVGRILGSAVKSAEPLLLTSCCGAIGGGYLACRFYRGLGLPSRGFVGIPFGFVFGGISLLPWAFSANESDLWLENFGAPGRVFRAWLLFALLGAMLGAFVAMFFALFKRTTS